MANLRNINYTLKLSSEKESAVADGKDINTILLHVENNGEAVSNLRVVFTVDGQAAFVNNLTGTYVANTDSLGMISLDIFDTEIETVTLSCFPVDQDENIAQLELVFTEVLQIFKIERVQTKSQTLYPGEPTIIWDSASFLVETSGGSGEIEWSFTGDYEGELKLAQDDYGAAEVTALSWFVGSRTVKVTDKVTGETAEHTFNISDYIYISPETIGLIDALNIPDKNLLAVDKLKTLYDQWGDLSQYNGWEPDAFYWTSEYNLNINKATCFNSSTGIFIEDGYMSFGEVVLNNFVYTDSSENG